MFSIRKGRMAFGAEVAPEPSYLINRTAGASLSYEPLMCDIANTAYDLDADEGGVFGNGITPAADATWTGNYLYAPFACVQRAGIGVGFRVEVRFMGITKVRATAAAPVVRASIIYSAGVRHVALNAANRTMAQRGLGWMHDAHGGTGVETPTCVFLGLCNTN